ncbi:hypothetical protein S7711_11298 [Stachybotrys chartarum IBT 7711]|uniref:Uncharacterized protein n=1 Tax=Stachybotrys chartarum (strain CBS 109288 / IBT 7711) TaxID=1280523 RepID=A0A084BCM0_STACB|nr:hypothetical protein S7711_11298 [Stachybotrys chartarum IBT 7711]KFA79254.1 hypothetical protein S40288_11767 [Stachybotrys chartarum IBT 40288]
MVARPSQQLRNTVSMLRSPSFGPTLLATAQQCLHAAQPIFRSHSFGPAGLNRGIYYADSCQDPSEDLDESTFASATFAGTGVYKGKETMLWKNSNAYYKGPDSKEWQPMRDTGQWTLKEGWLAYLSGGEIKKKT